MTWIFQLFAFVVAHSSLAGAHAGRGGAERHVIRHAHGVSHRRQAVLNISNTTQIDQKTATMDEGFFTTTNFYDKLAMTSKGIEQSHPPSDNDVESQVCPTFCCHLNLSCVYNTLHEVDCACADGSPSDDTCDITQSAPSRRERKNPWEQVMRMRAPVRSVCISQTLRNKTECKLHCHIYDIDDFTYSISGAYNGSAQHTGYESVSGGPCLIFIHVNTSYPELQPVVDKAMQYIGIIALAAFVTFICVLARQRDRDIK
ncbi:Hypp5777 [Branchiostoma lanceolatum]|uniref:Hypp5777 protein n=1 Tax=Branchiostoma lanceolatum TaxID=7740 RepID=A0A8J9W3X0_BRALA|nr:Hypp5777 [Branchiostoma lanceolatum]